MKKEESGRERRSEIQGKNLLDSMKVPQEEAQKLRRQD